VGLDERKSTARRELLQLLKGEAFRQQFPDGATVTEMVAFFKKGHGYLTENLMYLKQAGLVVSDENRRYLAAEGAGIGGPVTRRQATPDELDRVRAGVPSSGPLNPDQQERLDAYRNAQK
jgi:hypothetical protein